MSVLWLQEGTEPIEVTVDRIGGDLVARRVLFNVFPNGSQEFYGVPNELIFDPGVRSRKATVLARNDGVPEVCASYDFQNIQQGGCLEEMDRICV
jgi:hypothetical protein